MNQINLEKILIFVLVILLIGGFIFLFVVSSQRVKSLQLIFPVAGEEFLIEEDYVIKWQSRNIEKIGIVLFDGDDPSWIAKDIDASRGEYKWKIRAGESYGDNFWIAVLEYPYEKNSLVRYSKGPFSIVHFDIESCDTLSVLNEWPYIPFGFPEARRVFVTEGLYTGDLKGIDGANQICKEEAEKMELEGDWIAFLGGEESNQVAIERIRRSKKGAQGVFVMAKPEGEITRGGTCHRLIAKNFEEFLKLFYRSDIGKDDFLEKISNTWIGRISDNDKASCIDILGRRRNILGENYSFTVSCQNWTNSNRIVAIEGTVDPSIVDDDVFISDILEFPICYTPQGLSVRTSGLGGLSYGEGAIYGSGCSDRKRIICVED